MTPNGKAEELVDKYANCLPSVFYNSIESKNYYRAKQCALIAVDEMIECTKNGLGLTKFSKEYWQEVKQEIEKL